MSLNPSGISGTMRAPTPVPHQPKDGEITAHVRDLYDLTDILNKELSALNTSLIQVLAVPETGGRFADTPHPPANCPLAADLSVVASKIRDAVRQVEEMRESLRL